MKKPKQIVERMNMLFYAMIGLPMLLFAWVYLPVKDLLSWQESGAIFSLGYGSYLIAVILTFTAFRVLQKTKYGFRDVKINWPLGEKLGLFAQIYRKAFFTVMLMSILSVILLYLTRNQLFVVVYALLLFLVSLYRPSFQRLCQHLPLTKEEQDDIK